MRFVQSVVTVFLATTSVVQAIPAAPAASDATGLEEHIVLIDKDDTIPDHIEDVLKRIRMSRGNNRVRRVYNNPAFRGFSAYIDDATAHMLDQMPDVRVVDKSVRMSIHGVVDAQPWGLERISSLGDISGDEKATAFTYRYEGTSLGAAADLYMVDTGIRTTHEVFGGRARMGYSYDPNDYSDGAGHGTHTSGTAAGDYVGVARLSNIIGVKVLGADGSGSSADSIAGIDYVLQQHAARKDAADFKGSVISMSLGLNIVYPSLDHAVQTATEQGVHVVVAAGNYGDDACKYSPSKSGGANSNVITVGSVGINNDISSFSNIGSCVDVYGPGENVLSSWFTGDNILHYLDGTSMATPHVSGIVTYLLDQDSSLATDTGAMKARLKSLAIPNVIPTPSLTDDAKLLVNNGVTTATKKSRRSLVKHGKDLLDPKNGFSVDRALGEEPPQ